VVGALNCAVWLKYGFFIGDAPLVTVNAIGCLLQLRLDFEGVDPSNSLAYKAQCF
jgi:hypothetical protein